MNSDSVELKFPDISEYVDVKDCTYVSIKPKTKSFGLVLAYAVKGNDQTGRSSFAIEAGGGGNHDPDDEERKSCALMAGLGMHELRTHAGHPIWLLLQTHGAPVGSDHGAPDVYKTLTLFAKGKDQQQLLHSFVEKLIEESEAKTEKYFKLYSFNAKYGYWYQNGKRIKRPIESIFLPSNELKRVEADMKDFLTPDAKEWYLEHGIPYKRSYMFYGPPGSGKSSLIQVLAGVFDRNVCFLQPSHDDMSDDAFKEAVKTVPKNSVIVLEDMDSLFDERRRSRNPRCPLTFSGFLNGLDGLGAPEGQMFCLTTNFIDKLDSALLRAGRMDVRMELPHASQQQIQQLFKSFFADNEDQWTVDEFASSFGNQVMSEGKGNISMASLQNHFINHRKSTPEETCNSLDVKELLVATGEGNGLDEEEASRPTLEDSPAIVNDTLHLLASARNRMQALADLGNQEDMEEVRVMIKEDHGELTLYFMSEHRYLEIPFSNIDTVKRVPNNDQLVCLELPGRKAFRTMYLVAEDRNKRDAWIEQIKSLSKDGRLKGGSSKTLPDTPESPLATSALLGKPRLVVGFAVAAAALQLFKMLQRRFDGAGPRI